MRILYPFYFGCHKEAGHYWWEGHGRWGEVGRALVRSHGRAPNSLVSCIDGLFCPPDNVPEGVANLAVLNLDHYPVTILSFWDRTVDSRPGSHSTFVLPGELSFVQTVNAAEHAFPEIFARFKFTITQWRP
jgi:hypothetical protein